VAKIIALIAVATCGLFLWATRSDEPEKRPNPGNQQEASEKPTDAKTQYHEGFDLLIAGDTQAGIRLLEESAAKGNRDAQTQLGMVYTDWTGVPPDLQKALRFYTLAAQGGDNYAQDGLANIYERRSLFAKAYFWYRICEKSRLDTGATNPNFVTSDGDEVNIQAGCGSSARRLGNKLESGSRHVVDKQVDYWVRQHK
jgi:TPR repeat protein